MTVLEKHEMNLEVSLGEVKNKAEGDIVVIGVDGSRAADEAITWYLGHLHKKENRLIIVYAIELSSFGSRDDLEYQIRIEKLKQEKLQMRYTNKFKEFGLVGEFLSEIEKPENLIVSSARKKKATYIVMAFRSFTSSRKTAVGAVSNFVVRNADCPVVLATSENYEVESEVATFESLASNVGRRGEGDGSEELSDEDKDDSDVDCVGDADDEADSDDVVKKADIRGNADGMEAMSEKFLKASIHKSSDDGNVILAKTKLSEFDCNSRLIRTVISKNSSTDSIGTCTNVYVEQMVAMDIQIEGDCTRKVIKHTLETVVLSERLRHFKETFRDSDFIFFVRLLPLLFLCWFFLLTSGIISLEFKKFIVILGLLFIYSTRSSISSLVGKMTPTRTDLSLDYPR